MELTTAARRHLLSLPAVTGYVQQRVFKHRLDEGIEGTGGLAAVVSQQPGWATPDEVKTVHYPVLWVECHADPTRTDTGEIQALDAEDKAYALARVIEPHLHGVRQVRWGAVGSDPGLMIVSSARWQEPRLITAGDQHNTEPPLGDTVKVRTVWALQVAPDTRAPA